MPSRESCSPTASTFPHLPQQHGRAEHLCPSRAPTQGLATGGPQQALLPVPALAFSGSAHYTWACGRKRVGPRSREAQVPGTWGHCCAHAGQRKGAVAQSRALPPLALAGSGGGHSLFPCMEPSGGPWERSGFLLRLPWPASHCLSGPSLGWGGPRGPAAALGGLCRAVELLPPSSLS